jgi:hypothetical protein
VEPSKQFMVEGAELIYKNFRGEPGPYNKDGDRNFCVILEDNVAEEMARDGWAVKFPEPGDEESTKRPFIKVKVAYKFRPPQITIITSRARTKIGQDEVAMMDWADTKNIDLIAQAYNWTVGGKSGITAYLQTMFVIMNENALELKYASDELDL